MSVSAGIESLPEATASATTDRPVSVPSSTPPPSVQQASTEFQGWSMGPTGTSAMMCSSGVNFQTSGRFGICCASDPCSMATVCEDNTVTYDNQETFACGTSAADLAAVKVVLLDIEGTVCPISFVKDVLFPYALQALPATLDKKWDSPDFAPYRNAFPEPAASSRPVFEAHVADLVKRDVKVSYLKALQGYLWLAGYESGEIKAPLFPDVSPSMRAWHDAGIKLIIYSSGSVPAQKLLFGHTNASPPSLIPIISDWFDTVNAGMKMESSSYTSILSRYPDTQPQEWLFLSDNVDEVSAARAAGMHSLVVVRPGNAPLPECHVGEGQAVQIFEGLAVGGKRNESSKSS